MRGGSLLSRMVALGAGIAAGACGDAPSVQAPAVPKVPQFTVDITAPNTTTNINGALWTAAYPVTIGIDPFLSIQNNSSEEGFNTDAQPLPLNDNRASATDPLPLNKVPIISQAGGTWREFVLDANEAATLPAAQFSIDLFDIWVCHDSNAPAYATVDAFENNNLCSRVYNITDNGKAPLLALDAATDGQADYRILIPSSAFGEAANAACPFGGGDCGYYVVAHLKMGLLSGDWSTGDTFEQMSTLMRPAVNITKTPDSETVSAGSSITFTIELMNSGGGDATNVVVTDTLPAGAAVDWTTNTAGCTITGSPQVLTCDFGTVADGTGKTVTATSQTTTASCGVYDNRAWFSSAEAGGGNDGGRITVVDCGATITIVKNTIGGDSTFSFTHDIPGATPGSPFAITTSSGTQSVTFNNVPAGTFHVAETGPVGSWAFVGAECTTGGAVAGQTATINVSVGSSVTCTFTNRKLGVIVIGKSVAGTSAQSFTFTRRVLQDGSFVTDAGLDSSPTLADGQASSSTRMLPAGMYQVCETSLGTEWQAPVMTLNGSAASVTADGSRNFCTTFALGVADSIRVLVTNTAITQPNNGVAHGIGYWKNWSSCAESQGGQYSKAAEAGHQKETLDGNLPQTLGSLEISACDDAVHILNKDAIDGTRRPGDPIYDLSAQLLAALLNISAGAGSCPALDDAIDAAQQLLIEIGFDGLGFYRSLLSAQQMRDLNTLNQIMYSYNNSALGRGCSTRM